MDLFEPIRLRVFALFKKHFFEKPTLGDFTVKKIKIGKGNLHLTENQLSRNEMWCVADNLHYMCHTCAKGSRFFRFQI